MDAFAEWWARYRTSSAWRGRLPDRHIIARAAWEGSAAACAEIARRAGCICHILADTDLTDFRGVYSEWDELPDGTASRVLVVHDDRCPDALAAQIEARGGAAPSKE